MSIQLDDFLHAFSWLFTIALIAATLVPYSAEFGARSAKS